MKEECDWEANGTGNPPPCEIDELIRDAINDVDGNGNLEVIEWIGAVERKLPSKLRLYQ